VKYVARQLVETVACVPKEFGEVRHLNETNCVDVICFCLLDCVTAIECLLYLKVDVRQLKYFYMEDDGGGLLISKVHPDVRAAVTKVTHLTY